MGLYLFGLIVCDLTFTHTVCILLQYDSQGRATIAHMDIKANQFILVRAS